MIHRRFRAAGQPPPAKPPRFPHKPPANTPPFLRSQQSAVVRAAIAAAETRAKPST